MLSYASCASAPSKPLETRLVDIVEAWAVMALAISLELLPGADNV